MSFAKNNEKRLDLCPRLIDYVVVVGARDLSLHGATGDKQSQSSGIADSGGSFAPRISNNRPEILRRYPNCNHDDFGLPTDVVYFCQPDGCTVSTSPLASMRKSMSFIFSLTEKDSGKIRYGVSLNFLQRLDRRKQRTCGQLEQSSSNRLKKRVQHRVYALVSLCIISHHPFFTKFRQLLTVLRMLIDCTNQRIRCSLDSNPQFSDTVWAAILGIWQEKISDAVMNEIRQLETWILKLLSAPVPAPGRSRLELKILPEELYDPIAFALPDHTRFSLVDFPVYLLIDLLGPKVALDVILCILLEHKVVMQSRDYNAVSICVMASVTLLYPLEYLFPVIPLLPPCFAGAEQLLLAPTPFVMGIPASFFEMRSFSVLPTDIVLVDLDASKVTLPSDVSLPSLPESDRMTVINKFSEALNLMIANDGQQATDVWSDVIERDSELVDLKIRLAMVDFFDSPNMLGNFAEHVRVLRLYPRPVVALLTDSIFKSRPLPSPFVRDLLNTQAVEYFSECSLLPKNEAYIRVQNGIVDPRMIGDKVKWYDEGLSRIEFDTVAANSTLPAAWKEYSRMLAGVDYNAESDEDGSSSSLSSVSDLVYEAPEGDFFDENDVTYSDGPLCEVNNVYNEPLRLDVPELDNNFSVSNSAASSAVSSASSVSTCNVDSENDFAKLAQNLALKTNWKLPSGESVASDSSAAVNRMPSIEVASSPCSTPDEPEKTTEESWHPGSASDHGDKGKLLSAFNSQLTDYSGKTQAVLNEVLRTVPNISIRDRDNRGQRGRSSEVASPEDAPRKQSWRRKSSSARNQDSKNQYTVKQICDGVLAGHGVGVFALHKFRKCMEDENLRTLAVRRLHVRKENFESTTNEYVEDVQVSRSVGKGMIRLLQAAICGIEASFCSASVSFLASAMEMLEIAHSHYWIKEVDVAPYRAQTVGRDSLSVDFSDADSHSDLSIRSARSVGNLDSSRNRASESIMSVQSSDGRQSQSSRNASCQSASAASIAPTEGLRGQSSDISAGPIKSVDKSRVYLYEELLSIQQTRLWCNMQFWENVYFDAVAQEREIAGMDLEPRDLVYRYENMASGDKKRLELDEDKLLATILHNLCSVMLLTNCPKVALAQKIRRLLGKAHIGLVYSKEINSLLDSVMLLSGNAIKLKVCGYEQVKKHSFTVHIGQDIFGDMMFMEISDDAVILRGINGSLVECWWFEQLVNITFSPKTKVVCVWRRDDEGKVSLIKFYCKKCRSLYSYAKSAMEKAAAKGKVALPGKELCGQFSVQDIETKQSGSLHVQIDGLMVSVGGNEWFIQLGNIKKCNTFGGNIFVLEALDDQEKKLIQRKYFSSMAGQIGLAVHRMLSINYYQHCL